MHVIYSKVNVLCQIYILLTNYKYLQQKPNRLGELGQMHQMVSSK